MKPRSLCLAALLVLSLPTSGWAGRARVDYVDPTGFLAQGVGDAPRDPLSILAADNSPGLETLGDDVIRFSSTPIIANQAFIIEVHRASGGRAAASVTMFDRQASRWRRIHIRHLAISTAAFATMLATIDALMATPIGHYTQADEIIACGDDPRFVAERLHDNNKTWRTESYAGNGNPANYDILKAIMAVTGEPGFTPEPACPLRN